MGVVEMKGIYRTLLFMPAIKKKWLEQSNQHMADAIIFDLEDSVPIDLKEEARNNVKSVLASMKCEKEIWLRINKHLTGYVHEDLRLATHTGVSGVVLPKVASVEDVLQVHQQLLLLEQAQGLAPQTIAILPMLETAKALWFAYDIAMIERVTGIIGISSKNGDVERSLGTQWTPEGTESIYLKSRTVMAARAAGKTPIGGLWQDVHNLTDLKKAAQQNRQLGYDGELVLHPSNVEVVNAIYAPTEEEIRYYEGLIEAFTKAEKQGVSAVMYEGDHIDYAHVAMAKERLAYAQQLK